MIYVSIGLLMGLRHVECKIYRHEIIQCSELNFGPKFNLTSDCVMLLLRLEILLCKKIPMMVACTHAADNHIREAYLRPLDIITSIL